MSKKRYVDTKFWDDNYVISKDPVEKLVFLYLLTNTLTNIVGIYEISIRRIAFDTGIDKDMVIKILERFELDNKVKYENGWIAIKNFTKHQLDNPKINAGMEALIKEVPDTLIEWSNIDYDRLSHLNNNLNLNPNTNLNKEKRPATPLLNKPTKEPLEFSFTDKCWYGLDDWRIKMYQGKYPMLTINYLLEDKFKQKFLEKPKEFKELIKTEYNDNIENLIWAWLGQEKKFYLKDHPEYQQPVVENVSKGKTIGRNVSHIGEELDKLKGKFNMPETAKGGNYEE